MMMVAPDVDRLVRERTKRGLYLAEIAARSGLHVNTVSKAFRGGQVSLKAIRSLARCFRLAPASIIKIAEQPTADDVVCSVVGIRRTMKPVSASPATEACA